jgi:hypothetical protein
MNSDYGVDGVVQRLDLKPLQTDRPNLSGLGSSRSTCS